MTLARNRIHRDLNEITSDESLLRDYGIYVEVEDDVSSFLMFVNGPEGTPYEGGKFKLRVQIPDNYPFSPPVISFITKIWHPNIDSEDGTVCLDVLRLPKWKSPMTLRIAAQSIFSLLANPEPDSPQDIEAGSMMENNIDMFHKTARMWTYIHAAGPRCVPEYFLLLNRLQEAEVGRDDSERLRLLTLSKWDITDAANAAYAETENHEGNINDFQDLMWL